MKTEKDLNEFSQILTKITIEAALNAELDAHLGNTLVIRRHHFLTICALRSGL
ncbi:hypothetical protein KU392_07610 [Advenella alkanexedens]|uniref:Transposase n=1 Tax=Advenella alkanexedens TaxID=1481665 RepID=A0ABS6NNH4_9BURK|nr:hypothetical protein [Advenella alkanexedens]